MEKYSLYNAEAAGSYNKGKYELYSEISDELDKVINYNDKTQQRIKRMTNRGW